MTETRGPTIADVARAAGVNPKTVSQVLQHNRGTPGTQALVRTAADQLGYKPKARAASKDVLLVTPLAFNPPYYTELVGACRDKLRVHGYRLVHENAGGDSSVEVEAIRRGIKDGVAGALLVSPRSVPESIRLLVRARMPTVVVGARPHDILARVAQIHIDNFLGTYEAVRALREQGHTRIAYVRGRPLALSDEQRYRGFLQAVADTQGTVDPMYVAGPYEGIPGFEAGHQACSDLLNMRERPTAILAHNDSVAMGCLLAAHEKKVEVPRELSIVGHDDLPYAPFTCPPLSTVSINRFNIAEAMVDLLLTQVAGDSPRDASLGTHFSERESTAAAM